MARAKKKVLPKDIENQLAKGDLDELKALFDLYDVNARDGLFKQSALAFDQCPDELARWLVAQGADLAATNPYGETPLHARAASWQGRIDVLLELGADVNNGEGQRGTPLHSATRICNAAVVDLLIRHGARVDALDGDGLTPLASLLQQCSNAMLERAAPTVRLLLDAGASRTEQMKSFVTRIGTSFEFHRSAFDPDSVDAASAALDRLYEWLEVPPVPRLIRHDGKSPIVARSSNWWERHSELWELLVPPKGAAPTVQGEVIRISGRISDEMERNGGINWDATYRQMADAFLLHVASGVPLPAPVLDEARELIAAVKRKQGDLRRMAELAVDWVMSNPNPIKLPKPDYNR